MTLNTRITDCGVTKFYLVIVRIKRKYYQTQTSPYYKKIKYQNKYTVNQYSNCRQAT